MSNHREGRLAGKIAIVTGGASGIGRAAAQRLALEGAVIVVADLQEDAAKEVANAINKTGASATAVACNVSLEEQVRHLARRALDLHGRIDILANVAGISPKKAPVEDTSIEDFNRILSVNLVGTFLCIKHVAAAMKKQRYGRIVNVASMAAIYPTTMGNNAYSASKGGVAAMTRQLVLEMSPHQITVNAVAPGPTRTPMTEAGGVNRLQSRLPSIPLGRLGAAEDIAAAIAYLASDDASYMTGQMLVIDGGMTAVLNPPPG